MDEIGTRVARLELTLLEVVTALGMLVGELALRDDLVLTTPGVVEEALEHGWQALVGVPPPQDADVVADPHWAEPAQLAAAAPAALRQAIERTGAAVGAFYAIETDAATLVASVGYPPEVLEAFRTFSLDADLPAAAAARTRQTLWFAQRAEIVESYPHLRNAHEATEDALGETAVQGAVMPLVARGRIAAVVILGFTISRASPDPSLLHAVREGIIDELARRRGDVGV